MKREYRYVVVLWQRVVCYPCMHAWVTAEKLPGENDILGWFSCQLYSSSRHAQLIGCPNFKFRPQTRLILSTVTSERAVTCGNKQITTISPHHDAPPFLSFTLVLERILHHWLVSLWAVWFLRCVLSCLIEHHLFDKMAPAVSPSNSRGHRTLPIDLQAVTLAQTPALEVNIWLVLADDLGIVIADNVFFFSSTEHSLRQRTFLPTRNTVIAMGSPTKGRDSMRVYGRFKTIHMLPTVPHL